MVDRLLALPEGTRLHALRPLRARQEGRVPQAARRDGAPGLRAGARRRRGDRPLARASRPRQAEEALDRRAGRPAGDQAGLEKRLADSLETALKVGGGLVVVAPEGLPEETLSQNFACAACGTSLAEITPRLFSFNSPYGACPTCSGLGTLMGVDPDKVIVDPERSIDAGALALFQPGSQLLAPADDRDARQGDGLLARRRPGRSCRPKARRGDPARAAASASSTSSSRARSRLQLAGEAARGSCRCSSAATARPIRSWCAARSRSTCRCRLCPDCKGRRLRPEALAVKVARPLDRRALGDGGRRSARRDGPSSSSASASAPSPARCCRRSPTGCGSSTTSASAT